MITSRRRSRLKKTTLAGLAFVLGGSAALVGITSGSPAHADDRTPLIVVGTSDVYDSNLVQNVIEPGFEAAYPQYDLQYVSKGTGAAIAYAEAGSAAALIVHAATLENQFVDQGYSAEKYGRAIFYGDYILAGYKSDPAAVAANAPHDIVAAYEAVATAGAAGTANFVSRGGTPGTTVAEHQIWALTTGVPLCTVSAANGGGASPATNPNADGTCPSSITYPSWYHATGLTQGPNITNADTCNYTGGGCYVFTDRGTFDYLTSQSALANLAIDTRDNAATAPGGADALINSFHAYAINPAKFTGSSSTDLTGATDLLNWLTAPADQAAIGAYLNGAESPSSPPFLPDAAPVLTTTTAPTGIVGGSSISLTGQLTNAVPGTPALNGVLMSLLGTPIGKDVAPKLLAVADTDATGKYSFSYTPDASYAYTVSSPAISKVERPDLTPVFGDLLQATTVSAGSTKVTGKIAVTSAAKAGSAKLQIALKGTLAPGVVGNAGKIELYAAHPGTGLKLIGTKAVAAGSKTFSASFKLGKGTWVYQVHYLNPGVILAGNIASNKQISLP